MRAGERQQEKQTKAMFPVGHWAENGYMRKVG